MAIEITQDTILRILVRRGSEAEKNSVILAQGEPGYALDTQKLYIGDGVNYGGNPVPNTDGNTIEWLGTTPDAIGVADNGITNSKLAPISGNTVKGNGTGATNNPSDISVAVNSVLGRINSLNSGNLTSVPISTIFNSIFSLVAPDPTFIPYWFNLTNYKWYSYDGVNWLSIHQYSPSGPTRILYVGSGASVNTYDGGDTNAASVSGGPMWEIDTDYTSKVLRGAALGGSATLPLDTGGADSITQTPNMVPPHKHNVTILIPGHGGDDGSRSAADGGNYSAPNSSNPNFNWTGVLPTLPPGDDSGKYSQDAFNLPAVYEDYGNGLTSNTTSPSATPTLPAYRGILVLKRTSRIYYVA